MTYFSHDYPQCENSKDIIPKELWNSLHHSAFPVHYIVKIYGNNDNSKRESTTTQEHTASKRKDAGGTNAMTKDSSTMRR
jgi:hypothetical protein